MTPPTSLLVYPAFFLESSLEPLSEFLGGLFGPAFDCGTAAGLTIDFHPAAHSESDRTAGDKPARCSQTRARRFASLGFERTGSNFAQALGRHLETFNRRGQLG